MSPEMSVCPPPYAQQVALRAEWDQVNTTEVQTSINNPPGLNTIMGQLLTTKDPTTGKPLTLDQLKAEMVLAALAGFETTSMGLTWTLGALACHPRALKVLECELASVGLLASEQNPEPKAFSWQLLGRLNYLQVSGDVWQKIPEPYPLRCMAVVFESNSHKVTTSVSVMCLVLSSYRPAAITMFQEYVYHGQHCGWLIKYSCLVAA